MPEIGVRLPLHATSQGKLTLASLERKSAERLLKKHGMQPYTPHTAADSAQLLRQLPLIREQGYAVEDGEYKIGLRSVSAPVYDSAGAIRYILTTIGFFRRATSDDFLAAIQYTVEQSGRLSAALGYRQPASS